MHRVKNLKNLETFRTQGMPQFCPALQGLQDCPQGTKPGVKIIVGKVLYTFYHLAAFHCVKDLSLPATSAIPKPSQLANIAQSVTACVQ